MKLNLATPILNTALRRAFITGLCLVTVFIPNTAFAQVSQDDYFSVHNDTTFYDPNFAVTCTSTSTSSSDGTKTNTNIDYSGNQILNDAQLAAIEANKSTYEQAANQVDIPWQMLAVVHIRESGGKRENPSNGQGVYQFVDKHGGPYPTGPVDDTEFLRQTVLAAEFLKAKAQSSNYTGNTNLTAYSGPDVIKDTFFSYNGRSSKYTAQAEALGYSAQQGYEGSPYVMNKADAKRDPNTATAGTWGQIKTDNGPIEYPANQGYGAFVMYAALAGITTSGTCSNAVSGPVRDRVVALARQELAAWDSGQLKPNGSDFHKYTYGANANWCAYFVSWVFNQAGYPVNYTTKNGVEAAVVNLKNVATKGGKFLWHDATGYTPQVGDIVVQLNNKSHTNIVVGVEGQKITLIGGNQGYYGGGATYYGNSKVSQYTISGSTADGTTGYLSPVGTE